ncbi:MAG: hypothetical protein ABI833_14350 [Acidobacteriota bacterium]
MRRLLIIVTASIAMAQSPVGPQGSTFEGQPAVTLSNDRLQMTVMVQGSSIASLVMTDDAQKLSPYWNPAHLAREVGRTVPATGSLGHFVCVDGFGPASPEERAAGLPMHGEAHVTTFQVTATKETGGSSLTLTAKLPIVQEVFTRSFRMVAGENVVYVDSQLENLMGFDRPVNWAEHATVAAPFLEPNVTTVEVSGSRSQTRPYTESSPQAKAQNPTQRRLTSGQDFTWPMAPGLDGKTIDIRRTPEHPHYLDHTATLLDPSRRLEWVASFNSNKRVILGYVFKREDYPWVQYWGSYPADTQVVRGMEFGTQPYDLPRRETITDGPMFGTPVYRWLPAKSKIESHFLLFYARVPEGFQHVDDVRLENGRIVIEDRRAQRQLTLEASRGL